VTKRKTSPTHTTTTLPENIRVETPFDGVRLIRINRPEKRNALNEATLREIAAALTEAKADDAVRVAVITGDQRAFAAGADVTEMLGKSPVEMQSSPRPAYWDAIRAFPKPLIAAVSGWCLGGGNELALCCDMIVASQTAQFGQPEINLAIMPGAGGTQRLPRAVGKAVTMEMALAGRSLSAQEALALGLVNRVVAPELYLEKALELARIIAAKAPLAARQIKEAVLKTFELPLEQGLAAERRNYLLLFDSEDKEEGIAAFLDKRSPTWKGR
jgi:enoyl-CoA hydratase